MVISFGRNSDSNYLELRPLRGVLEERYFGNLRYFAKYMLEHCKEAVAKRCSVKKVFLEISQNSQEKTCARVSFLIKDTL